MFPQPMIPILSLFMSNPPFMIDLFNGSKYRYKRTQDKKL
jgi:hypothetical protein